LIAGALLSDVILNSGEAAGGTVREPKVYIGLVRTTRDASSEYNLGDGIAALGAS